MPKSRLSTSTSSIPDGREVHNEKLIEAFRTQIKNHTTEDPRVQLFINLLDDLFDSGNYTKEFLNKYLEGHEKTIKVNRNSYIIRGRTDGLFGNVIIEYERDLKSRAKFDEAQEQLRRYSAILWEEGIDYIAIASDCEEFIAYSPISRNDHQPSTEDIELREISRINLQQAEPRDFYFWLDRFFFREQKLDPTTKNILDDFGPHSHTLNKIESELGLLLDRHFADKQIELYFEQWDKYLRYSYGATVANKELFLRHTYLALLAKLFAWLALAKTESLPSDSEIVDIFSGDYFKNQNIGNFLEEDFFSWIAIKKPEFQTVLKNITRKLTDILLKYRLDKLQEDILKALYQGLVDPEQRHDLGEYYTPDWLAALMVEHVLRDNPKASMLDPGCGSGTFLYAGIRYKAKHLKGKRVLYEILASVTGIDIHPLSVIIAKTNYLLALGDLLQTRKEEIHIPVYLANSITPPEDVWQGNMFDGGVDSYRVTIDESDEYGIPRRYVDEKPQQLDEAIDVAVMYAIQRKGKGGDAEVFQNLAKKEILSITKEEAAKLYILAEKLRTLIEEERDSIWGYIIRNFHRPVLLKRSFDIMIGNPPWLAFRYIESGDYQSRVRHLINQFNLESRAKNITHLELAALFWVKGSQYYLKDDGMAAFVMPRSVFNGSQHENFRNGNFTASRIRVTEIWDCNSSTKESVTPLFKVPSCVLFGSMVTFEPKKTSQQFPIKAKILSGGLKQHNAHLLPRGAIDPKDIIKTSGGDVHIREGKINLQTIGSHTAWDEVEKNMASKGSPYAEHIFQGATIVPRSLWFVEPDKPTGNLGINKAAPKVHTDPRARKEAKKPYDTINLKGNIEKEYLYGTLLSTDLIPFGHFNYRAVILPAKIEKNKLELLHTPEAHREGDFYLQEWLQNAEQIWDNKKADKNDLSIYERLNYSRGITRQNLRAKYRVVYPKSGSKLCAAIVFPNNLSIPVGNQSIKLMGFVATDVNYYYETSNLKDAHFLCAILNSSVVSKMIEPLMSKGFGGAPRDIHKKPFELSIPVFDKTNKQHLKLAEISLLTEKKVEKFLRTNPPAGDITPGTIGGYRNKVRAHVKEELAEIDKIVAGILK